MPGDARVLAAGKHPPMWVNLSAAGHFPRSGRPSHADWMMLHRTAGMTMGVDELKLAAHRSAVLPFHDRSREAAAGQGRRLAARDRARPRRPQPARGRRPRLALGPLGPDQGRSRRLHRRRAGLPERADVVRRAFVLRDPARRLPGPGRVLADRDRLRGGRGDEQLPAREHRHVRDADDVRRDHSGGDVRRRRSPPTWCRRSSSRSPGTFVYLYLFLSVPGSFDENFGNLSDHPAASIADRRRRRPADRDPRAHLLAPAEEAVGEGEAGRRDPLPAEGVLHAGVPSVASAPGSASSP